MYKTINFNTLRNITWKKMRRYV